MDYSAAKHQFTSDLHFRRSTSDRIQIDTDFPLMVVYNKLQSTGYPYTYYAVDRNFADNKVWFRSFVLPQESLAIKWLEIPPWILALSHP